VRHQPIIRKGTPSHERYAEVANVDPSKGQPGSRHYTGEIGWNIVPSTVPLSRRQELEVAT
jgi:hypothetical protein